MTKAQLQTQTFATTRKKSFIFNSSIEPRFIHYTLCLISFWQIYIRYLSLCTYTGRYSTCHVLVTSLFTMQCIKNNIESRILFFTAAVAAVAAARQKDRRPLAAIHELQTNYYILLDEGMEQLCESKENNQCQIIVENMFRDIFKHKSYYLINRANRTKKQPRMYHAKNVRFSKLHEFGGY